MKPSLLPLVLLAAVVYPPPSTRAAESFDACTATIPSLPATIWTGGRYCLTGDLATAITSGVAIDVNANNVTIDCNGFKVGNLAGGPGSTASGVFTDRANTRIVGCHFRGFWTAVHGGSAHGARIENNLIEGAIYSGINISGEGTRIVDNQIMDIGPNSFAYGIVMSGRGDIRGNIIDGVTGNFASGIYGTGDFVVAGNTVRGLAADTATSNWGITVYGDNSRPIIERNRLQANSNFGISISCTGFPAVRDNSVIGFTQSWGGCPNHGGNVIRSSQPEN